MPPVSLRSLKSSMTKFLCLIALCDLVNSTVLPVIQQLIIKREPSDMSHAEGQDREIKNE